MSLSVTKRFNFCYAHHLPNYDGPCARVHGHNAEMEIEFQRKITSKSFRDNEWTKWPDMIIDFTKIKQLVQSLINQLDHQYLNELDAFSYEQPTVENIVHFFLCNLIRKLANSPVDVTRIRISEGPNSWAEWRINDAGK